MKGLPTQIDLTPFAETELIQLCVGTGQVQFHFANQNSINVESAMVVHDRGNEIRIDDYAAGASLLASMIGARVSNVTRQKDGGVLLRFEGDRSIQVLNDSAQYESLQILIAGRITIG